MVMDRKKDYTRVPGQSKDDAQHSDGGGGNNAIDLSVNTSDLRMIIQDESIYDDPTKKQNDWWLEDPSREPTLITLWEEHRELYDMTYKHLLISADRPTILKKFATILSVPR